MMFADFPKAGSDISTVHNCTMSATRQIKLVYKRRSKVSLVYRRRRKVDLVYKRRKLLMTSSEEAAANGKVNVGLRSVISSEDHLFSYKKDGSCRIPLSLCDHYMDHGNQLISEVDRLQEPVTNLDGNAKDSKILDLPPEFVPDDSCLFREKVDAMGFHASVNDRCSSSKSDRGRGADVNKTNVDETAECFTSGIAVNFLPEITSKEFCIDILRNQSLLGGGMCSSIEHSSIDILHDSGAKLSQSCKVCGCQGSLPKMLICDVCNEAYHLSCCKRRMKKLPHGDWCCQSCFGLKRKSLLDSDSIKLCKIMNEACTYRKRRVRGDSGPIALMLRDTKPYLSEVRIGKDFQAELPDCNSPIPNNDEYFLQQSEWDATEFANVNIWSFDIPYKLTSIGNWIQCREVLCNSNNPKDEGTVCGKWRRAPLFIMQTDDWDCSCCVLWDPMHADCAVPQEVETDVVHMHLKYIKLMRPHLATRKPNPVNPVTRRRL